MGDPTEADENPYAAPEAPLGRDAKHAGRGDRGGPVSLPVALTGCSVQAAGWLLAVWSVAPGHRGGTALGAGVLGMVLMTVPGLVFLALRLARRR